MSHCLFKILDVKFEDGYYYIDFIVGDFFPELRLMNRDEISAFTDLQFGSKGLPFPGVEKGYIYIGQKCPTVLGKSNIPVKDLFTLSENIPCSVRETAQIKLYPIVKILNFEKNDEHWYYYFFPNFKYISFDKNGDVLLTRNKNYIINYSYYQGDENRSRIIKIDSDEKTGKFGQGKIFFNENFEGRKIKSMNVILRFKL